MIYLLSTGSSVSHLGAEWGILTTPQRWGKRPILEGRIWAADNGAFTKRFDPDAFMAFLEKMRPYQDRCLFAVAPDVVGDAKATLALYGEWRERIRALGYPVAYAAQNGAEALPLPPCEAVFIGGDTAWKLGPGAAAVIARARREGKWVHVGRVNSRRRIRHFQLLGVDSVDGTHHAFMGLERSRRLLEPALKQKPLFTLEEA